MSKLTIFSDKDGVTPLAEITDLAGIQQHLASIQVHFARWQADQILSPDPDAEEVLAAYRNELNALMAEKNYQSFDVISMRADHPERAKLRQKFLSEHTHQEDEVRFFCRWARTFLPTFSRPSVSSAV
jgi:1,2-dihydroxy-3-keto-5-methylthiopentene dioxygenase